MIRGGLYYSGRLSNNFAAHQTVCEDSRYKHKVHPHVWIPGGKGIASFLLIFMKHSEAVAVTGVQHDLNGVSLQLATTDPYERSNPCRQAVQLQQLAWRQRVEVAHQHMKTMLVPFNAFQQRTNLACPPLLVPFREPGAEMKPEDPRFGFGRHHLQKGMLRP